MSVRILEDATFSIIAFAVTLVYGRTEIRHVLMRSDNRRLATPEHHLFILRLPADSTFLHVDSTLFHSMVRVIAQAERHVQEAADTDQGKETVMLNQL